MLITRKRIALATVTGAVIGCSAHAPSYVKAVQLLKNMERGGPEGAQIVQVDESLPSVRGHWYLPPGTAETSQLRGNIPVVVIVHGLQYQGIDSKRLITLTRSFADQGFAIYTPEIAELIDYKLDSKSVTTIRHAIDYASVVAKRPKVGLFGISFGAGLALEAAADESAKLNFVGTLGGYGSAVRVSRFLTTGCADQVEGGCKPQVPHDYGTVIFLYDYADEFFSAEDAPIAKRALQYWLHENQAEAKAQLKALSPAGSARLAAIFDKKLTELMPEVQKSLERHRADLDSVSASNRAKDVTAKAFLLHAAGDAVVPDTELGFLASELPHVEQALVSHALGHAEIGKGDSKEKLRLVHFMAAMLRAADP
jgi:pimeloyl-ACP methyl ester carboxylesterase